MRNARYQCARHSHNQYNGSQMQKKEKTVAAFVALIDHRRPPMFPSRYVTNSSRPLSDVTNLLSSKTRADSTIERDNRTSTLTSMTSIRHTFNFCKNFVTHVENVQHDESCDTIRRSIERIDDRIRDARRK